MKNDFPTAIKLGAGILIFIALIKACAPDPDDPKADNRMMAQVQCVDFVKQRLKSPSTAEFQSFLSAKILRPYPDQQKYTVISHVDSQNSFGANLRSTFICEVEKIGKRWTLIDLAIE